MLKNKKWGQIIMVTVFVVAICMQFIWWFLFGLYVDIRNIDDQEAVLNIENRVMASKPMFSLFTYPEYFANYEKYFNDNYKFRTPLISINSKLDYFVFNRSTNEDVILGEDGWLFFKDTLADYEKERLYTQEELDEILTNLLETQKYMDQKGVEFIVYVAPNKNTIYGEYMPQGVNVANEISRTEQAVDYVRKNSDITIIYPKEELVQAKEQYPNLQLYFKLDSHWNYIGGYFGVKPIMETLGIPMPSIEEMTYEAVNEPIFHWNGYDLANMLGLTGYLNQDTNYRLEGYSGEGVTYEGDASVSLEAFEGSMRTYCEAGEPRKLYFARDSFGESMTPYLAKTFGEMYSISRYTVTQSSIEEEAPDVFLYEMSERYELAWINVHSWPE